MQQDNDSKKIERAPLIEYPFPLREGQLCYLKIPCDIKKIEIERIKIYLDSLVLEKVED